MAKSRGSEVPGRHPAELETPHIGDKTKKKPGKKPVRPQAANSLAGAVIVGKLRSAVVPPEIEKATKKVKKRQAGTKCARNDCKIVLSKVIVLCRLTLCVIFYDYLLSDGFGMG